MKPIDNSQRPQVGDLVQYIGEWDDLNGSMGVISAVIPVLPAWSKTKYMYRVLFGKNELVLKPHHLRIIKKDSKKLDKPTTP